VEIYCTTLDMSTNVYDRYYVAEGDRIVDVWPIMGRGGAPRNDQRERAAYGWRLAACTRYATILDRLERRRSSV